MTERPAQSISYERDVSHGQWLVERTDAGTTFYFPPPTLWPLGCLVVAATGMLAGIGLVVGGRMGGALWALALFYGLVIVLAVVVYFRQRNVRQQIDVDAVGVRFSQRAGGRSRAGWIVPWAEVEAIETRHIYRVGDVIELRGTHPKRMIGGGSLMPSHLRAIREAMDRGLANARANGPAKL